MTDGQRILAAIEGLMSAEKAISNGAEFAMLTHARERAARTIDEILNKKATIYQAIGFGMTGLDNK